MYIVTEMLQSGAYLLKCEQEGTIGNHYDGNMINIDAGNNAPSAELIEQVQTLIDPIENSGEDLGIAPIGHSVIVEAANAVDITITTHLTLKGSSWENLSSRVNQVIEEYFSDLRANWSESDIVVRISQIEARLLDIEGIIDIEDTKLNGSARNLYLSGEEVPVLVGVVNLWD